MSSAFHTITDGSRVLGFVAIDSPIAGRARGGLRIAPNLSEDEIRAAARAMTLKYGFLGLPQGGAKAGIVGDGEAPQPEKQRLLLDFARAAEPLLRERAYIPDADLGTDAAEIRWMMESLGVRVGPREWTGNRSGEYTARSCLASARALLERRGESLEGRRVAIEGFGKVGTPLALLLHAHRAKVVAISTSRGGLYHEDGLDVSRLAHRAAEVGAVLLEEEPGRIDRAALLELGVDILFPCARYQSIHAGNASRVAARAICAGANDPVSPEAEGVLHERGIPYPPDFMTNCGGVLGGTLEFAGVPFDRIGRFIEEHVHRRVLDVLDDAERVGASPRSLAEPEALVRHARVRAHAEHPNLKERLVMLGVEAYRREWVPQGLVSRLATKHLARRLS